MNSARTDFSRLTGTYSIVALDAESKQLGIAMQTHNFEACNGVIWAEPGVGVVASQAGSDPFYAFAGLEMMRLGKMAAQVLPALRQCDAHEAINQVAMLDIHGNVAAYTGGRCIREAGHVIGQGYTCQANHMPTDAVCQEMASAFEQSQGELADRIMEALEAAEQAGGDIRGAQSAAIKIVSTVRSAEPWEGYLHDFKVYDSHRPLQELRRLIATKKAHEQTSAAHRLLYQDNVDEATMALSIAQFEIAVNKIPNSDSQLQHQFYYALSLLNKGQMEKGLKMLKTVFAANPLWRDVTARIAEVRPDEPFVQMLDTILAC